MHAGAVPVHVLAERLAVPVHVHAVFFAKAEEEVAGHPDLIGGRLRAFAEDLEFPLALRHFGVDAFVIDAGIEAEVEVRIDDLARNVADVLVADAGVIFALRRRKAAALRKAERRAVLVEKVFLLEAEPRVRIIENGRARICRMRGVVGQHDFAHHERAVRLGGIGINGDGLEQAVGAMALGLARGAAVEAPDGELFQRRERSRTP